MVDLRNEFELHEIPLTPSSRGSKVLDYSRGALAGGRGGSWTLYFWIVLFPCFLGALYLFVIAADRYVSEAKFLIRSAGDTGIETVASIVQSNGASRAKDETYVVNAYINSRDAMEWLLKNAGMRGKYDRPTWDLPYRFPNPLLKDTLENYFSFYRRMVDCETDEETGIMSLSVSAFSPEDARQLGTSLLKASEALLNDLNLRAEEDAVASAENEVRRARQTVADVAQRLRAFRNVAGFVNGQNENEATLKTVTALMTQAADAQAELQQARTLTPKSPQIASLTDRVLSYQKQIRAARLAIAGNSTSLAAKMAEFEKLTLDQRIAERTLTAAVAARETARQTAQRQHLYLQVVVEPNLPDQNTYPRRFLWMLLLFVTAQLIYTGVRTARQFAIEHAL